MIIYQNPIRQKVEREMRQIERMRDEYMMYHPGTLEEKLAHFRPSFESIKMVDREHPFVMVGCLLNLIICVFLVGIAILIICLMFGGLFSLL